MQSARPTDPKPTGPIQQNSIQCSGHRPLPWISFCTLNLVAPTLNPTRDTLWMQSARPTDPKPMGPIQHNSIQGSDHAARIACGEQTSSQGLGSSWYADATWDSTRAGRRTLKVLRGQNLRRRPFTLNARLGIQSSRSTARPALSASAANSDYALGSPKIRTARPALSFTAASPNLLGGQSRP